MADPYVPIPYPSWVYPVLDGEPPLLVRSDAELAAVVSAPIAAVGTPTVAMPVASVVKVTKIPVINYKRPKKET